jgi:hypothetical protein
MRDGLCTYCFGPFPIEKHKRDRQEWHFVTRLSAAEESKGEVLSAVVVVGMLLDLVGFPATLVMDLP